MDKVKKFCTLGTDFKENEQKAMWLEGALEDLNYYAESIILPQKAFSNFKELTLKEIKILEKCIDYIDNKQF